LGDKVRHVVKYTWPMVISMRKKAEGYWGTDIGHRPKWTIERGQGTKACTVNGPNHR
jgi:hypothetical protein